MENFYEPNRGKISKVDEAGFKVSSKSKIRVPGESDNLYWFRTAEGLDLIKGFCMVRLNAPQPNGHLRKKL